MHLDESTRDRTNDFTGGRAQLLIHWRSDESACVQDLPDLREIHLFGRTTSITWPSVGTGCRKIHRHPRKSQTTVDAWHRDYGLTWESVIFDGQGVRCKGFTLMQRPHFHR